MVFYFGDVKNFVQNAVMVPEGWFEFFANLFVSTKIRKPSLISHQHGFVTKFIEKQEKASLKSI